MLGIGSTELALILFFGFLIFGPEKLPEMGRTVGRAIRQFRTASDEASAKFKEEVYDPFQDAIDPYKSEIEKTVAPIKEDIDAINDSFTETKQAFTDPLGTKARKKEAQERKQELRNTLSFNSKKDESASGAAAAKQEAQDAIKAASLTAADAKTGAGIDVDDPFAAASAASAAPAAAAAPSPQEADELAALYDFDSKDGE
ncbi:MAG: twin-arginine translocase TatA/TatE family subunit [Coriobacteriales bacterium]